jgi:hypothetical protein
MMLLFGAVFGCKKYPRKLVQKINKVITAGAVSEWTYGPIVGNPELSLIPPRI